MICVSDYAPQLLNRNCSPEADRDITPSNEHPGLISFKMDWLDLLAVQGPLKSLLQHHSESINSSALSLLYPSSRKRLP